MGLFDILFKKKKQEKRPEDYYKISVTRAFVKVEHPERKTEQINWADINEIAIVTTDEGPLAPDAWLLLSGDNHGCAIPWGARKYNDVFDVISKYEGFNFEAYVKAAGSAENARFEIWKRK